MHRNIMSASTAASNTATTAATAATAPEVLRTAQKAAGFWDTKNAAAAATHPGFKPYPDLRWTSGPWKPSYEPWDF